MRYRSVCSGIEAATVAWEPLGWRALSFSEIEPFPCSVLAHRFPSVPNLGDMTRFAEWSNDDPTDVLVGGTPCQSFSVAGLRRGMRDPRGNLALAYCGILDRFKPRWFVWENVPGVLSSWSGDEPPSDLQEGDEWEGVEESDFGRLLDAFSELGYGWAWSVRDAQYFGVPQRRRRVFVVGHLGDWRRAAAVLFEPESLCGDSAKGGRKREDVTGTLASRTSGGGGLGTDFDCSCGVIPALTTKPYADRESCEGKLIASTGRISHCLNAGGMGRQDYETETLIYQCHGSNVGEMRTLRAGENHTNGVPFIAEDYKNGTFTEAKTSRSLTTSADRSRAAPIIALQSSQSGVRTQDVHATLDSNNGSRRHNGVIQDHAVRRLTPRECERLQGFPDDWTQVPHRKKPSADGPGTRRLATAWRCRSWRGSDGGFRWPRTSHDLPPSLPRLAPRRRSASLGVLDLPHLQPDVRRVLPPVLPGERADPVSPQTPAIPLPRSPEGQMMQRRSFLQSMAAAFSAMSVGSTPKVAHPAIDYSKFCESERGYRFSLESPFVKAESLFATDSRILITHPFSGDSDSGTRKLPNVQDMVWDEFEVGRWRELHTRDEAIVVEAPKMWQCECTWRMIDDGFNEERIPPRPTCEECHGTGSITGHHTERLSGAKYDGKYVDAIRGLGPVEYRVIECDGFRKRDVDWQLMLFRFGTKYGDGRGMLMNLTED